MTVDELHEYLKDTPELLRETFEYLKYPEDEPLEMNLLRSFAREKRAIPDRLHETILRAQLRREPHRLDLTRSLVGILARHGRPLLPDLDLAEGVAASTSIDELLQNAAVSSAAGDAAGLYAALWQLALQHSDSARGWAELARALVDRRRWQDARDALARAMADEFPIDPSAARASLYALDRLGEPRELKDLEWKKWFERLPDDLRADSHAVDLLNITHHPAAPGLAAAMLANAPAGDFKAYLVGAMVAHDESRHEDAYHLLRKAFECDLGSSLREVVNYHSAQVAHIIRVTERADEFTRWLGELSSGHEAELILIPPTPAPEMLREVRRLRQTALDRGLPSPIFIAQGKSASVSVANIFNSGFALPTAVYSLSIVRVVAPWLTEYLRGGACYTTHLWGDKTNVALISEQHTGPVIVHVRDPRQVVVSLMEHRRRYAWQVPANLRAQVAGDDETALDAVVAGAFGSAVRWIDAWVQARRTLDIRFTTFEQFVTDRDGFIDRMLEVYGAGTRYFDRSAALAGGAQTDYHRRLGSIDEWRTRMTPKQVERINAEMPSHFWDVFDWSP